MTQITLPYIGLCERHAADPGVQALLVLCSFLHQAYKDILVLMQQKATENIKHICGNNSPTRGQRQTTYCMCVYPSVCSSSWMHLFSLHCQLQCPCAGLTEGWVVPLRIISWWRSWLAVELDKLCLVSAACSWPILRQRAHTLDPKLAWLQGCLDGVQRKEWASFIGSSLHKAKVITPLKSRENQNPPSKMLFVLVAFHSPDNSLHVTPPPLS